MVGLFKTNRNPVDELASTFRNYEDPVGEATAWARRVLAEADIDPNSNPLKATKKLRDEEPALKLDVATYLMKKLTTTK